MGYVHLRKDALLEKLTEKCTGGELNPQDLRVGMAPMLPQNEKKLFCVIEDKGVGAPRRNPEQKDKRTTKWPDVVEGVM